MNGKLRLISVVSLGVVLLASGTGVTRSSFIDPGSSTGNTFQAWTSTPWVQTTQADFEAGVLNSVDISSSPGNVKLGSVAQEPTTSIGSEESWYYPSWSRRAPITINNPGSGLTDYQVKVDVTYDADMRPDFDDIRFVDSDDSTQLSHWREGYTASTSATFWVKVPSIPSGNKTIYMYYGNSSASSASDGMATFVFFDDFESGTLNKWTTVLNGTFWTEVTDQALSGTYSLRGSGTSSSDKYIFATGLDMADLVLESMWRVSYTGPDIAQAFRASSTTPINEYEINWEGQWTMAKMIGGSWSSIRSESGTIPTNTWFKMTTIISGTSMKVLKDDVELVPPTGWTDVGAQLASGTIGFRAWTVTSGQYWWIDDVRVRKHTDQEPTTSVGLEDGWSRRAPVTINNPGSGLTDFQVRVDVTYDADMQPDFDDIRFVDSDDSTPLSHWRESYTASSSATFWVKVPSIPSGAKTIYMYYGNAAASSASDGNVTFIFFDDFEVDLSKWTEINPGHGTATQVTTPTAPHGSYCVEIDDTSDTEAFGIKATFTSQSICVIEFYMRAAQADKNCRVRIKDSAGAIGPFLRFSKFSTIQHKVAGTWTDTTLTYSADTWYEFKLTEVDSADDTYDIWIDGDLKQDDAGFNAVVADISRVAFLGTKVPIATFYVDLVRVRKYPPPSAYISSGTIASQVLDTGVAGARWDALFWDETLQSNTDITFKARASNTPFAKDAASPSWTSLGGICPVTSGLPSGRYMQWQATLTTSDPSQTPTLHEVRVYYSDY